MADTRSKGTLKKWFDDKGYGFISSEKDKKDIFIHISGFGRGLSRGPQVGDTVFFYVQTDKDGKRKAVDAIIKGVASVEKHVNPSKKSKPYSGGRSRSGSGFLSLVVVLLIMGGITIYNRYFTGRGFSTQNLTGNSSSRSVNYTCQGKTHCSQMSSCEEATFYIQHCPGTKMDGDHDGIPCERQLCN